MKNKIIFAICILISFFLGMIFPLLKNNQVVVNEINNESLSGSLAIMVFDENTNDYIKQDNVPVGKYQLNENKTYCEGGGKVVGYSSDTGKINYKLLGDDKCYIYFDVKLSPLWESIISLDNISDIGLQQTLIEGDDLYRFAGITGNEGINNYICLGTTSKCESGSDNMYRIIGVNPVNGEVKVIKETPWNNKSTYSWHDVNEGDPTGTGSPSVQWLNSALYKNVVSKIYDELSFKNIIVPNHIWKVGFFTDGPGTGVPTTREAALISLASETITTNVGILSVIDFYLACNEDIYWWFGWTEQDITKNWIAGYFNGNPDLEEWTMSRGDKLLGYWGAWIIAIEDNNVVNAGIEMYRYNNNGVIRPTFYLNSSVNLVEGTGTSLDPFIIK